jgi:hypothetical protein
MSVQRVHFELDEASIKSFLCGKEAYFETDYVVLRRGDACAVAKVHKANPESLFCLIKEAEGIASPDDCRWIDDSTVDTGNPSALAEKARALGLTDSETLVVNGLYEHANFIHRPRPLVIHVFDLSPPDPPRLFDMARRVVAHENFPAIVLNPHIQSIPELARNLDHKPILFPCRVSQLKGIAQASYLDKRPARQDWVLVGCERSRMIHHHFYGDDCPNRALPEKAVRRRCFSRSHAMLHGGKGVRTFGPCRGRSLGCRAICHRRSASGVAWNRRTH